MYFLNWYGFFDATTGVKEYYAGLGTAPCDEFLIPMASYGLNTLASWSDLSLVPGTRYYGCVRAIDGVGNNRTVASSGVVVDITAPLIGETRFGRVSGTQQLFTSSLHFLALNWDEAIDEETGIAKYLVGLGTTPGATDVALPSSFGTSLVGAFTSLELVQNGTYYAQLFAQNPVGLMSNTTTVGITVDATPPVCTVGLGTYQSPVVASVPPVPQPTMNFYLKCQDAESGVTSVVFGASRVRGIMEIEAQDLAQPPGGTVDPVRENIDGTTLVGQLQSGFAYYLVV